MKKFRNVLLIIIGIVFLVASFQILLRVRAEERNKMVEIVADYNDFYEIASQTNTSINEISNKLISAGVTSIAISEECLLDMESAGKILLYNGVDLKHINVHFNNEYQNVALQAKEYIDNNILDYSNITLVMGSDSKTYDFLENSFKNRFRDLTYRFRDEDNRFCILIKRNLNKVKNVGLGLTDDDFEFAKTLGFNNIIPRIENHEEITKEEVDDLYKQLKKYKVRTVIFAGVTVYGQDYQDKENEMLKYIGEKFSSEGSEIITAIIEKPAETDLETAQRGIKALSKYSKYVNTKVFSTDATQLQRLGYTDIAEQWGRAISQRNVRVLYVRPLAKAEKTVSENFEDTTKAIYEIKDRIAHMGMKLGSAKGLGEVRQNNLIQMIISFGTISAGFLLLILIFGEDALKKYLKIIYSLYIVSMLGILLIYVVPCIYNGFSDLVNKVISLCASVIFASLAGVYLIHRYKEEEDKGSRDIKKIIKNSIVLLICSVLIAVIGGIYIGAILSDSKYILKLDTFRGVKISFLLPLFVWGFTYVIKCGLYQDGNGKPLPLIVQCKKLFSETITVKYVVIFGVVILALAIIVMRSGNTMISSASSIELMFRNFLEKYLVARPRTKELIAFPILMFILYFASLKNKEFSFLAMGTAMIGIEDIINSFCHIRMPVLITSLSIIYSLIFAVIIGSIGIIIVEKVREKLSK